MTKPMCNNCGSKAFKKYSNKHGTYLECQLCGEIYQGKEGEKKWRGTWPADCQICGINLAEHTKYFIDGATARGPWALMCELCHITHGRGLGVGRGQKYDSKTLKKVGG